MEIYPIDIAIHLVNIAILYIILRVLVWNPVSSFMKQRSDRVKGEQQKAEGLMAEAEKKNKEYDELLKNARTEGESSPSRSLKGSAGRHRRRRSTLSTLPAPTFWSWAARWPKGS